MDALLSYLDYAHDSLDAGKQLATVFLDFSKAFDTVNHAILLGKMEHYGIRGQVLSWFSSYLSGRTQCVEISGVRSSTGQISRGVIQGSLLGPILFTIYINDMCNSSKVLHFIHYADDTTVFCCDKDVPNLMKVVNTELNNIDRWIISNRLSLNFSKSSFFISSNKPLVASGLIFVRKSRVKFSPSAKLLGVIMDEKLNFNKHVNNICTKLSRNTGILNKLSSILPITSLIQILLCINIFKCKLLYSSVGLGGSGEHR